MRSLYAMLPMPARLRFVETILAAKLLSAMTKKGVGEDNFLIQHEH